MYLPTPLRESAQAGQHNFLKLITDVAQMAGFEVSYSPAETVDVLKAAHQPGYSLFHMQEPLAKRSVSIRRAYFYPFWHIERSNKRWQFEVATSKFPTVTHPDKMRFFEFWQKRLFSDAPKQARRDGIVLIPLQGKLLVRRSFQACSPIEMIEDTLKHDPHRQIIATLHPNEIYSAEEITALEKLEALHDRFECRVGGSEDLLRICDYVVTQNSAVAFSGFFFRKPCILFARSDFHHIAINVSDTGVEEAFEKVLGHDPDYQGYVHWFLQDMSINAGRPEAADKIKAALVRAGWPMNEG